MKTFHPIEERFILLLCSLLLSISNLSSNVYAVFANLNAFVQHMLRNWQTLEVLTYFLSSITPSGVRSPWPQTNGILQNLTILRGNIVLLGLNKYFKAASPVVTPIYGS